MGAFGAQMNNFPIPTGHLPEPFRDKMSELIMNQSIGTLEDLARSNGTDFQKPWPPNIVNAIADKFDPRYHMVSAHTGVGKGHVVHAFEAVRNRLLDFALELRDTIEVDLEDGKELPEKVMAEVSTIFQTVIMGNNNVVASGENINQSAQIQVEPNDFASLSVCLEEAGVHVEDIALLEKAIEDDGEVSMPGEFGPKVSGWFGKISQKMMEGSWKVAIGATGGFIAQALAKYYGWG